MTHPVSRSQHAKALLVLGGPLIGSHLAQMAIGVTDNVMLGWYAVEALAAATLSFSAAFVLFIVGSGFAFAVLPMVARSVAAGDEVRARRATRMGLWISALYGGAMMPLFLWSEPLLRLIGQSEEIAALSGDYLRIFGWGLVPSLLVMVLKSYLAALERTQVVLWVTVAAAILNGGLNYVLIFGRLGLPELGIEGAAIASVLMQLASLALLVVYIRRTLPDHALFQRLWRADWEAFGRVFRLGWPIGLTNLAESGLFSGAALMVGWVGTLELAAHGAAVQLASITFVFHLGLSQAATVRAGHALGLADGPALREGARVAMGVSVGLALVASAAFLLFPDALVGLFLDPGDPRRPDIIEIGAVLLIVAALFQLVDGAQVISLGLLRGVQDTKVPMVFAAISYWGIGIPSSYVLGFVVGLGAMGIWIGLVIGLLVAAVLLTLRFWTKGVATVPTPS